MKGIAHFLTGMALATCLAPVVRYGGQGSLLPVLGGVGGLLPDVLDFRFARYWAVYADEIDPGPEPSATQIADALLASMTEAFESGRPRRLIARSIRLDVDLWRTYTLAFRPERGEIEIEVGPLVNGAGIPYPGTTPAGDASARLLCPVPFEHTYADTYTVATFAGPSFRFVREDDRLEVHFLDWHHRWTHSLLLGAALGVGIGAGMHLLFGPPQGWWGGLLIALGYCAHVLEDQLGHMGCNLLWPLTRKRMPGLGWLHAGDVAPNTLVAWTAWVGILLNLERLSDQARLPMGPAVRFALLVGPWLVLVGARHYGRFRIWLGKTLSALE
jgi:membrane-bound metal-dependent hydrolase YbcI (DUF457 family)